MKNLVSFFVIFLSVLSGFIVLGITESYFCWLLSVIVSTILFGAISKIVLHVIRKMSNKAK